MNRFKIFLIGSILISLLLAVLSIVEAIIIGLLIDCLANEQTIVCLFYGLLSIMVMTYIISLIRIKIFDKKFIEFKALKQEYLVDKVGKSDFLAISKISIGEIMDTVVNLSDSYYDIIKSLIYNYIPNIFLMLLSFVICLIISWQLTIVGFLLIPLLGLLGFFISKPITKKTVETSKEKSEFNTFIENCVQLIDIIKIFSMNKWILKQNKQKTVKINQINNDVSKVEAMSDTMSMMMGVIPYVVFFIGGALLVYYSEISVGLFLVFITIFNFVYQGIPLIQEMSLSVNKLKGIKERINKIIFIQDEKILLDKVKTFSNRTNKYEIYIDNISFSYGENNILKNYSLRIKNNCFTVIKGENGSGKSTLIKLLSTIYIAQEGNIFFGNTVVSNTSIDEIRNQISFVPQNSYIVEGTIKDNICLGNDSITNDKLDEICKKVHLTNFVSSLKDGYLQEISINKLSTGQSQKINIARALFKNPKYLFLDEFTSNLDIISSFEILEIIKELSKNITVVYVTHINDHIEYADEIIYLNKGCATYERNN